MLPVGVDVQCNGKTVKPTSPSRPAGLLPQCRARELGVISWQALHVGQF